MHFCNSNLGKKMNFKKLVFRGNKKAKISNIPYPEKKLFASSRSFNMVGSETEDGLYVSKADILEKINKNLIPRLEIYEFKFIKSNMYFKRKTNNGEDILHLNFYDFLHYELQIHIKKRIDQVQKIITQFNYENNYNSNNDFKKFYTVTGFYPEFERIILSTETEIDKKTIEISDYMEKIAIPCLDSANSIVALNKQFNYPEENTLKPLNYYSKNKVGSFQVEGMVLAFFANDKTKYYDLYEKFSNCDDSFQREKTIKLHEYLQKLNYSP